MRGSRELLSMSHSETHGFGTIAAPEESWLGRNSLVVEAGFTRPVPGEVNG